MFSQNFMDTEAAHMVTQSDARGGGLALKVMHIKRPLIEEEDGKG